jgi:hypothetical protein
MKSLISNKSLQLPGSENEEFADLNLYNYLFCSGNPNNEPYEIVIVLQDGSKWKIDPNK